MHNEFYASGFLYYPTTEQILLQQYPPNGTFSPTWSLFGGVNKKKETPSEAFLRIFRETTGISLDESKCFAIYDYFHKRKNLQHYLFYAEVNEAFDEESLLTTNKTGWFTFKQLLKLDIRPQTRQDITVGQRVINLAIRQLQPTNQ